VNRSIVRSPLRRLALALAAAGLLLVGLAFIASAYAPSRAGRSAFGSAE